MAAAAGGHEDELRRRAALREAFGDSSDSDTDASRGASPQWRWEAVPGVRGLWLCSAFLSADEQSGLLAAMQKAMRFGDLPIWAVELSVLIREAICLGDVSVGVSMEFTNEDQDNCPLPSDILWREPLSDQLTANRYKPGEGICAHVDLMRFDDGIAIVCLVSDCAMHFCPAEKGVATCDTVKHGKGGSSKIPVYLKPGSLVLISGDARYFWKHEINRKPGAQLWDGKELEQHRRTSVTPRKLPDSPI